MKRLAAWILCGLLTSGMAYGQTPEQPRSLQGARMPDRQVTSEGQEGPIPRILGAIEHRKRVHVDEQKRLYVSLSAPLFLRLALSPEDEDHSFLFHGPGDSQVAMPFYLDGPGRHSINHPSGRKATGFSAYVYADGQPPATSIRFSGAPGYRSGDGFYYGKGLEASVISIDDLTGIMQTYVALDDTIYTAYKNPIALVDEKTYRLRYYAVDRVGNSEPVAEVVFTVDTTPPSISMRFGSSGQSGGAPDMPVYPSGTTLEMSAQDRLSGVDRLVYAINSDPEQPVSGPVRFDRPGDYTVVIRAADHVNNSENQVLRFQIQ